MVTAQQALDEYVSALSDVGADLFSHHFRFEGDKICIGHGREEDHIQWGMTWHSPEEFYKMAKRRRLNLRIGDPKKPY